jgi:serine/threonine-protein kinase
MLVSEVKPAPKRSPKMWVAAGAIAVAAVSGVALWGGRGSVKSPAAAATSLTSASAAVPSATTTMDLPKPASANPAALAAYVAAVQAEHDAASEAARRGYEQAVALDPSLGAANLRLANLLTRISASQSRTQLQKAASRRAALSERDRVVLDALSPSITHDPADFAATERALALATERYPGDAELWQLLAVARSNLGRLTDANAAIDRSLALDPKYAMAWGQKGLIETYGGTREGALSAFAKCIEAAPGGASGCLHRRAFILGEDGRCAEAEQDAKAIVATDPDGASGYLYGAESALALGKPRELAEELLRQALKHTPTEERAWYEAQLEGNLDVLGGDFVSAEIHYRAMERAAATTTDFYAHAQAAFGLATVYTELGDVPRATAVANEFLRRRDAWTQDVMCDDYTVESDVEPDLLAILRRSGALSREAHQKRLADWASSWQARLSRAYVGYVWIVGYAGAAADKADAELALAELPKYEPLPWYRSGVLGDALVGHAYLLAGRPEARSMLEVAVKSCRAFEDPITYVASRLWLGQAREQAGDKAAACEAYGDVLHRWGKAPHSVTAHEAKGRAAALKCAL